MVLVVCHKECWLKSYPEILIPFLVRYIVIQERVIKSENAKKPEDRPYDCYGGRKLLVVDDIGDVWPCEILKDKFGNLRDHEFNINRLLEKHEAKNLVKFRIPDLLTEYPIGFSISSKVFLDKEE